jgi:hypothetical protein
MNQDTSPYYPRRARWYSPIFYFGFATRQRFALEQICLPEKIKITLGGIILSCLIPGLAFYIRGFRLWGRIVLLACAFLFLAFIVWLGYPVGNYAFGLMLSIHASGLVYYCSPMLQNKDFWHRILLTIAVLLGLGLFFYVPMRSIIQNHWALPLLRNGHVVIVGKFASAGSIKRGDWVMYSLPGHIAGHAHEEGGIWVREGYGWGPVLAMPGDRVTFAANAFAVNGVEQPLLPHMPHGGDLIVPENKWFIWPKLGISGHGNASETVISGTMLQLATVSQDQFVGRPFKRWFWRKQILP